MLKKSKLKFKVPNLKFSHKFPKFTISKGEIQGFMFVTNSYLKINDTQTECKIIPRDAHASKN